MPYQILTVRLRVRAADLFKLHPSDRTRGHQLKLKQVSQLPSAPGHFLLQSRYHLEWTPRGSCVVTKREHIQEQARQAVEEQVV